MRSNWYITAILFAYLALYALFGIRTVPYYPSYSYPGGDEGTYLSYAQNPWTLISEYFEGFRPKEVMNPYNFRLFLTPFSVVFALFGFTYVGARLVVFGYGVLMLILAYGIGERLGSRVFALLGAILLSLSPPFLFFTHGIRPEGMMALFVVLCVWITLRRRDGPSTATYGQLAFASSSMVMIHFNGVLMPLVFFVALIIYDRGRITIRKLLAFVLSGIGFAGIFILVNLLPAWSTIQEFGILPVTFVSKSKIPVLHPADLWQYLQFSGEYYFGYFRGLFGIEQETHLYSSVLLIPTVFGLLYQSTRRAWCVATSIAILVVMLLVVFPNVRDMYTYLIYPLVFILGAYGLSKVPNGWLRTGLAVVVFGTIASAYVWADWRQLQLAWYYDHDNRQVGKELRNVIDGLGGQEDVTVMGCQEFHVFVPDVKYRTFHSFIITEDLNVTFGRIKPDIVLLHERTAYVLGEYKGLWRPPDILPTPEFLADITAHAIHVLQENGYRKHKGAKTTWDGKKVEIYYKPGVTIADG